MTIMPTIIKIIAGVIGTVGFAILFRLKPLHWIYAGLVGLFACVAYFALMNTMEDVFLANLTGAFVCALSSELFARIAKAPTTVFVLPGIIALVPGRTLYYTMSNLLNDNYIEAGENLLVTITVAVAIGGGIIAASILRVLLLKLIENFKSKIKG